MQVSFKANGEFNNIEFIINIIKIIKKININIIIDNYNNNINYYNNIYNY